MKKLLTIFILLVLLLLVSCGTKESVTEPKEGLTKGVLTSTYKVSDENSSMKIVVNNIDKTGSVDVEMYIVDEDEWGFSLDEGTYTVDDFYKEEDINETMGFSALFALVYTLPCELTWAIFRDYDTAMEDFANWTNEWSNLTNTSEWTNQTLTDEETKEQEQLEELIKGFKATKFSLKFVDKEDSSTILECYNKGLEQEDLVYKAYNTTTEQEIQLGEEAFWGDSTDSDYEDTYTEEEERSEYASCVDLGCDEKHVAIGDRSTNEWYYCDCYGATSIATEDRTCFSSIDVAEAVGYYQAWGCE